MRKLPVLRADDAARRELRGRLSLSARPRLNVELGHLDRVSSLLASNSSERARFVQDPTAYLRAQSLPVSACHPVTAAPAQTSEACTVNVACNVNFFININAVSNVNASVVANILTVLNIFGREITDNSPGIDRLSPSPFHSNVV